MNLEQIELDVSRLEGGTIWKLHYDEVTKVLSADPVDEKPEKDAWLHVVPINLAYKRALREAREPHREAIRDDKLTDYQNAEINGYALAEVLLGWGNLSDRNGPIEFSKEKARELLMDQRWGELAGLVEAIATNRTVLLANQEKAAAGNLSSD